MRNIIILLLACFSLTADARPSIDRLIGTLDIHYHIRSDILSYINVSTPRFSRSWMALIKIAQNQHFLYYEARNYHEAEKAVMENSIAQKCLNMEYNDDEGYEKFKQIESRMGDTKERKERIFEVSTYYFSRRGFLHPKVSRDELENRCNSGNYG